MSDDGLRVDAASAVDLSYPIDPEHFRWAGERIRIETLDDGAPFTTTRFSQSAHAFTHADAPSHVEPGAADVAETPLRTWVGSASVLDLSGIDAGVPITADDLDIAARRVVSPRGTILLLRTDWDLRRDVGDRRYWTEAPWIDRGAAEWLRDRMPRAVGFDFPQDEAIGHAMEGRSPSAAEFVSHHHLLRHGVGLIEYLRGLGRLSSRVLLVAAPIALVDSDGAPVRALALPILSEPVHPQVATATERSS